MRYSVRCCACRRRKTLPKRPEEYYNGVGPKCDSCGSGKGWRLEPYHYPSRKQCNCNGPVGRDGSYPHEPSHPLCVQNPDSVRNAAQRAGMSEEDIAIEFGGEPCGSAEAPF